MPREIDLSQLQALLQQNNKPCAEGLVLINQFIQSEFAKLNLAEQREILLIIIQKNYIPKNIIHFFKNYYPYFLEGQQQQLLKLVKKLSPTTIKSFYSESYRYLTIADKVELNNYIRTHTKAKWTEIIEQCETFAAIRPPLLYRLRFGKTFYLMASSTFFLGNGLFLVSISSYVLAILFLLMNSFALPILATATLGILSSIVLMLTAILICDVLLSRKKDHNNLHYPPPHIPPIKNMCEIENKSSLPAPLIGASECFCGFFGKARYDEEDEIGTLQFQIS